MHFKGLRNRIITHAALGFSAGITITALLRLTKVSKTRGVFGILEGLFISSIIAASVGNKSYTTWLKELHDLGAIMLVKD